MGKLQLKKQQEEHLNALRRMRGFEKCKLCAWSCGVDRTAGEVGVCGVSLPEIAYTNLAFVLRSYSVTLLGCCFRCIYCNAYRISQYPQSGWFYRGFVEPEELAEEAIERISSEEGREMLVNKISFTGGEPTLHLPYIEEVVRIAQKRMKIEVGFATNGFASQDSMRRIVRIASHINFEIKAFNDDTHRAITGAPVEPVLRNAEFLVKKGRDKIRTIRTVVIPHINDGEVEAIAEFLTSLDETVPFRIIPFRPSFMLYYHAGPSKRLLERLARAARKAGLKNVWTGGYYPRGVSARAKELLLRERVGAAREGTSLATAYARLAGCIQKERNCGKCPENKHCPAVLKEPWLLELE
ncbi:MAG: radical SAM protein [Candidatus Methanospirare jalkutatii]|nr:radical SAM protein [Candidatus Methanospirare jalkutatii]